MAIVNWDVSGERFYETGVDHGILYFYNLDTGCYDNARKWDGLISVTEGSEGGAEIAFAADGNKYFTTREYGSFRATIEALAYPDGVVGFDGLDQYNYGDGGIWVDGQPNGGGNSLYKLGMCYRTIIGNDTDQTGYAYRYHLIYNATFSRPERKYKTLGDSPEATTYTWDLVTGNVDFQRHPGLYPTSHIVFDTKKVTGWKLMECVLTGGSHEFIGTLKEPVLPNMDLALELLCQDRTNLSEDLGSYLE